MGKHEFITSCCDRPIGDCPGCPQPMMLISKSEYEDEQMSDESKNSAGKLIIFQDLDKYRTKLETLEDLQQLIDEAAPESMRDRLRRRSAHQQDTVRSHQDEKGHSDLKPPVMADRIQPKREKADRTQMQHAGKLGHRHSARNQRGRPKRFTEAIDFLRENIGKPFDKELLAEIEDRQALHTVAIKLMGHAGINRDWLSDLCDILGNTNVQ